MIEVYRRLATATNRSQPNASYFADLDSAIVDVQLFGSADQIAAAQKFSKELAQHRAASLDELLASLRYELREELKLDRVDGSVLVLRASFDAEK